MGKDPAFLFYPNDFDAKTKFLTDEQVGKYLRLLIAEFQHGRLNEKQVLYICKTYDEDIMQKFQRDENGLFFNDRLEFEINKRKTYSESRSKNRKKNKEDMKNISVTYVKHMENENENENINRKKKIKNVFIPPTLDEVINFFDENGYINAEKAWNYYNDGDWKDSKGSQVINWKQKMRVVWFKDENKKTSPNEFRGDLKARKILGL